MDHALSAQQKYKVAQYVPTPQQATKQPAPNAIINMPSIHQSTPVFPAPTPFHFAINVQSMQPTPVSSSALNAILFQS